VRVIADAKPQDESLVRGFGADVVVPRGEGFADAVREVAPGGADAVFDTALLHDAAFGAIRDGGTLVVVRGWRPDSTPRGTRVLGVRVAEALERTDWLEHLRRLASDGALQLRAATELPPERAAEAHRLMEAGGLRGRAVIVF
jgi:NADPH:quinone reductase